MEVIDYTPPASWDGKGMNWSKPDLGCVDYAVAFREALIERAILVGYIPDNALYNIMPYRPLSVDSMNAIRNAIHYLAPYFVNMEFDDYKEDLSDFPKMWTFAELIESEDCRICEYPGRGALVHEFSDWFKMVRNAINKLTSVNFTGVSGSMRSRSASHHDPPFGESISTVMQKVMENKPSEGSFSSFPQVFYAWSGNTDYKKDKDGTNGYCGYAESRDLAIKTMVRPHPTAECDVIFRYKVSKPVNQLSYSSELQYSVLDLGNSGLETGIHTQKIHWSEGMELDIKIGNVNSIPRNSTVPSSQYKSNYNDKGEFTGYSREIGRSAKTGYEGVAYCILDFGVENGFKFRAS